MTSYSSPCHTTHVGDIVVPGKRFVLVLYQNKKNYRDCLVEVQYCDVVKSTELSMDTISNKVHMIDKNILDAMLEPKNNGFNFIEIQGRHLIKFDNLYPSIRPSETVLRSSPIGSYLSRHGIEAALILCYPKEICSFSSASLVRRHMENIYSYCSEASDVGYIRSQIKENLKKIEENKSKISKLEDSRRKILDDAAKAEITLANYGLKFYGKNCDYNGQHHFAFQFY